VLYFDTSFLTPLLLMEATTIKVGRFLERNRPSGLSISHWTRVEVSSLLAREVRMGGIDREMALEVDARFESIVQQSFAVLLPTVEDFDLSKEYLRRYETKLRIGDAFHLAIAKNHRASMIHSFDKGLLKAAKLLGLPAESKI
jgi:predicted nucleic acid-binding protein